MKVHAKILAPAVVVALLLQVLAPSRLRAQESVTFAGAGCGTAWLQTVLSCSSPNSSSSSDLEELHRGLLAFPSMPAFWEPTFTCSHWSLTLLHRILQASSLPTGSLPPSATRLAR